MRKPKIFGIGFQKTGTTSLGNALALLGYRVTGPNGARNANIAKGALKMALRIAKNFDAFQDNPWPILFRDLDQKFPNSKYILTERASEQWIESVVKHFGQRSTPMREWIYGEGCPEGNEEVYIERYARHNAEVKDYFANRPDDLLVLRIVDGDGWDKLCRFLGKEIPTVDFPHSNSSNRRKARRLIGRKGRQQ